MNKFPNSAENSRANALFLFAAPLFSIAVAVAIQASAGLEACPLCILQRLFLMAISVTSLFSLKWPSRSSGYVSSLVMATLGLAVAAWHVHLQMSPPQDFACAPTLMFTLENSGLVKALPLLFKGSGSCSTEVWAFHGISFPELSVANFLMLALVAAHGLRIAVSKRKFPVIGE